MRGCLTQRWIRVDYGDQAMAATVTRTERYQRLAGLCERFSVDILYVFGSRAFQVNQLFEGNLLGISFGGTILELCVQEI